MELLKYIIDKIIYGGGVVFDLAKWLIVFFVFVLIINTFFISLFFVDGLSMEPNLHNKEAILWDKNAYHIQTPRRFDVVAVNAPSDPTKKKYVKRVIGLPGDFIEVKGGKVYLNSKQLDEEYLPEGLETPFDGSWNLTDDQYFVMGDNRPNSNDSRAFGPVERRFVLGKGIAIIFPRFRLIKDI
ncbi:MAG: signal peptidase I [Candidatus Berkelbacteria bacterium]